MDITHDEADLEKLVENLNYELKIFEEQERVILVEKNAAATAVAEIIDEANIFRI